MMSVGIYKAKDGQDWFIGFYSNKFMDRQGDILSNDSHKEYAQWVNEKGIKPPIILAHQPQYPVVFHLMHYLGLASGKLTSEQFNENLKRIYKATTLAETERVVHLNGFSLVVGKVVNKKLSEVIQNSATKWGMSHGFLSLSNDGNIIEKYRTFEFSVLPNRLAANSFTSIGIRSENNVSLQEKLEKMGKEDRKALKEALGTIDPDVLEEGSQAAQEILEDVLPHKSVDGESGQSDQIVGAILKAIDVEGLQKSLKTMADAIMEQKSRIDDLEVKLQEKQKEIDQMVAEQITPGWDILDKMFGDEPEDEKTIEQIKENLPAAHKEKSDNPLQWGFWDFQMGGKN